MGFPTMWVDGTIGSTNLHARILDSIGVVTAIHLHAPDIRPDAEAGSEVTIRIPVTRGATQLVRGSTYRVYTSTNTLGSDSRWNVSVWINAVAARSQFGVSVEVGASWLQRDGTLSSPMTLEPGYYAGIGGRVGSRSRLVPKVILYANQAAAEADDVADDVLQVW